MVYKVKSKDEQKIVVEAQMPKGRPEGVSWKELGLEEHVLVMSHANHSSRGFYWKVRDLQPGDEFHIYDY